MTDFEIKKDEWKYTSEKLKHEKYADKNSLWKCV